MQKKLYNFLYESSFSLSVVAFLLLGFLLGSLDENNDHSKILTLSVVIIILFSIRLLALIAKSDRNALFVQFYQWMFEASVIFIFAAFQQSKPVLFAVFLMVAVALLLVLFLIVFSKVVS